MVPCGCILSKFYIKPQLARQWLMVPCVVSYRNSTSNHNSGGSPISPGAVVSYRNSTSNHNGGSRYSDWLEVVSYRNSTSNHNIGERDAVGAAVVSYRNSTSNHNGGSRYSDWLEVVSYRNSTSNHNGRGDNSTPVRLYLIEILHQTTTYFESQFYPSCCILSKFYIKPQQTASLPGQDPVVSYRNSTSNHNFLVSHPMAVVVVSYRNSTSNHNVGPHID